MVAAVAQLYLGSMTFFAAREARAASGSAWRLSSPQLRLWGLGFRVYGLGLSTWGFHSTGVSLGISEIPGEITRPQGGL